MSSIKGADRRESREAILEARVLRVAGIRALEAAAQARRPSDSLMERAGRSIAAMASTMTAEHGGPILVLAGPGNNGGDGLVAARELHRQGFDVRVALLDEGTVYKGAALLAWTLWQEAAGGRAQPVDPIEIIDRASLIVDGLYGIGYDPAAARAPTDRARAWFARIAAARCPILAIDIPSGVDADTGQVGELSLKADRTLTFLARKPGLETGDGVDRCGEVVVDLLGTERDDELAQAVRFETGDFGTLNRPALFEHAWKPRKRNSHKGSYGSLAVVGGNDGTVGAALLAARMGLHSGAGRVYVRLLSTGGPTFDVVQPELMLRASLDGVDADALAIGSGLGRDDRALAALEEGLATESSLVVDADGLNAIASQHTLLAKLVERAARALPIAVLTPHPLEAARLLGTDVEAVQRDRIEAAIALARRTASVVVLKGAGSVVADAEGRWVINPTGNPALATGGTGDVLCGLVGGLMAQGMSTIDAARMATWVHGTAADELVENGTGPVGVTSSELVLAIRKTLNRIGR